MALPLRGEIPQPSEQGVSEAELMELDEIMTGLYYRDSLTAERLRRKGSPVELRDATASGLQIRLERLGGSVTLLCLWDSEDNFVSGRRTTKAGDEVTQRHDFTPTEVTPTILQEFRDIDAAVSKLDNSSPSWRGPWVD